MKYSYTRTSEVVRTGRRVSLLSSSLRGPGEALVHPSPGPTLLGLGWRPLVQHGFLTLLLGLFVPLSSCLYLRACIFVPFSCHWENTPTSSVGGATACRSFHNHPLGCPTGSHRLSSLPLSHLLCFRCEACHSCTGHARYLAGSSRFFLRFIPPASLSFVSSRSWPG